MNKESKKIFNLIVSIAAPLIIIAIWQISCDTGKIKEALLPSFYKTILTAVNMVKSGKLQGHVFVSLARVIKGYALGAVLGIAFGILMGFSPFFNRFLGSIVGVLRPIPMIAWVPLLILWEGIGEGTKITVIALGTFWSVLLNTIHGIQSVDPKLLEVAKTLKKDRKTTIFRVIFPSALPTIFTGLRLGIGMAWASVVAAETLAASKGVGFMITYSRQLAKPAEVLVGVFTIGLIGYLIDTIIMHLQKRLIRWND